MKDIFWILPGELAGMSHPGADGKLFSELRESGIGAVVTLTERPLGINISDRFGFECLHLPIRDMDAPHPEQVELFVRFCDNQIDAGNAVAVHCLAGRGRTGVMLACYLVHRKQAPGKAIEKVRRVRPGALETPIQEAAVYEYAAGV